MKLYEIAFYYFYQSKRCIYSVLCPVEICRYRLIQSEALAWFSHCLKQSALFTDANIKDSHLSIDFYKLSYKLQMFDLFATCSVHRQLPMHDNPKHLLQIFPSVDLIYITSKRFCLCLNLKPSFQFCMFYSYH